MNGTTSTTQSTQSPPKYRGEVVYIFAYDLAYETRRQPIERLMGQPVSPFTADVSKRSPRTPFFYRSQTVRLPEVERMSPHGMLRLQRSVKILPVGAISITVRAPFECSSLEELVAYHELKFTDGKHLTEHVRQLTEEVRNELRPYLVKPNENLGDEEAYTVFCIDAPLHTREGKILSGEDWLQDHRRSVAALLTEEGAPRTCQTRKRKKAPGDT